MFVLLSFGFEELRNQEDFTLVANKPLVLINILRNDQDKE